MHAQLYSMGVHAYSATVPRQVADAQQRCTCVNTSDLQAWATPTCDACCITASVNSSNTIHAPAASAALRLRGSRAAAGLGGASCRSCRPRCRWASAARLKPMRSLRPCTRSCSRPCSLRQESAEQAQQGGRDCVNPTVHQQPRPRITAKTAVASTDAVDAQRGMMHGHCSLYEDGAGRGGGHQLLLVDPEQQRCKAAQQLHPAALLEPGQQVAEQAQRVCGQGRVEGVPRQSGNRAEVHLIKQSNPRPQAKEAWWSQRGVRQLRWPPSNTGPRQHHACASWPTCEGQQQKSLLQLCRPHPPHGLEDVCLWGQAQQQRVGGWWARRGVAGHVLQMGVGRCALWAENTSEGMNTHIKQPRNAYGGMTEGK